MFALNPKKARRKQRTRSRLLLIDLLEARNLLAGDGVDMSIELAPTRLRND